MSERKGGSAHTHARPYTFRDLHPAMDFGLPSGKGFTVINPSKTVANEDAAKLWLQYVADKEGSRKPDQNDRSSTDIQNKRVGRHMRANCSKKTSARS